MTAPFFEWVDADDRFRLAIMPRPNPLRLEEHLVELKQSGVDVIVSMLESDEANALGLEREAALCAKHGIAFHQHPIPDHSTPVDRSLTESFARTLLAELQNGRGVVIHCFAGIGRSATMAAAVMILAGFTPEEACKRLTRARGFRVPETPAQLEWLCGIECDQ